RPNIGGAVGLPKNASGTLFITGGNTYAGTTTINAGTLASSDDTLGLIPNGSDLTIAAGATYSLTPNGGVCSDTVGALSGAGAVALGANPVGYGGTTGSLLTVGTGADTIFSGQLAGARGRFTKQSAGKS